MIYSDKETATLKIEGDLEDILIEASVILNEVYNSFFMNNKLDELEKIQADLLFNEFCNSSKNMSEV